MPRDLRDYYDDLVRILGAELGASEIWDELILPTKPQVGILTFSLRYGDGSSLRVAVVADCSNDPIVWRTYRFQYLDERDRLRFRYDNAAHHPELPNFPHHLHLPGTEALDPAAVAPEAATENARQEELMRMRSGHVQGVPQPGLREIAERIRRYVDRM